MRIWVYEKFPTNYTAVHQANCGFCNDGLGTHRAQKSGSSGTWHGPFNDLTSAESAASTLNRPIRIHSCCGKSENSGGTNKTYQRFQLDPVDEWQITLEELFHRRMLEIYVSLTDEIGYSATRFLRSVRAHGGMEHAKRSLRRPVKMQAGFERLKVEGRLHQSMESHVCALEFRSLFSAAEIAEANRRLNLGS